MNAKNVKKKIPWNVQIVLTSFPKITKSVTRSDNPKLFLKVKGASRLLGDKCLQKPTFYTFFLAILQSCKSILISFTSPIHKLLTLLSVDVEKKLLNHGSAWAVIWFQSTK